MHWRLVIAHLESMMKPQQAWRRWFLMALLLLLLVLLGLLIGPAVMSA